MRAIFLCAFAMVGTFGLGISTAFAANTTWGFKFSGSAFALDNTSPTGISTGFIVDPPGPGSANFKSPNGASGFINGGDIGGGVGEGFANMAAYESADSNPNSPWSLSQGTSNYTFSPDFSGIAPGSVPIVTINQPIANSTTANPPTFLWTTTGTTPITLLQINNADFTVDEQFNLPGDASSFTLPAPLPAGTYNFFIDVSTAAIPIPVSTTLVSGPDLKISPQGTFQFSSSALESFTVAPEPTSAALASVFSLLLFRIRRIR
jgi:hypothetical protein